MQEHKILLRAMRDVSKGLLLALHTPWTPKGKSVVGQGGEEQYGAS